MGWSKYCKRCSQPRVGFANGKGQGYEYRLPRVPYRHLKHSTKIFRISDYHFRAAEVQTKDANDLEKSLNDVLSAQMPLKQQDDDGDDDKVAKAKEDGNAMDSEDSEDVSTMEEDDDDPAVISEDDDSALISEDDAMSSDYYDDAEEEAEEDDEDSEDGDKIHKDIKASKKKFAASAGK